MFVSLRDQLPAEARAFGIIHGVHATPAGIFFLAENRVLRWRDGHFKVWALTAASTVNRLRGGWAGGNFYVHNPEVGLLRLENEAFVSASADPPFHRATVCAVFTGANDAVLIGTEHDGLFTLRDGMARPWEGALGGFLREKRIHDGTRLRDGSLAIATASAGLVLLDKEGRFRNRVDEAGGLHGGNLYGLCEDAEGGLWIGPQTGLLARRSPPRYRFSGRAPRMISPTCSVATNGSAPLCWAITPGSTASSALLPTRRPARTRNGCRESPTPSLARCPWRTGCC